VKKHTAATCLIGLTLACSPALGAGLPSAADSTSPFAWSAPTPDRTDSTSVYGAFAYADSTGTSVTALTPLARAQEIRSLLSAHGRLFPVKYEGTRAPGRPGAAATQIFRLEGARVWPGEYGFLATDSLLQGASAIPIRREFHGCERDEYSENTIETRKNRSVAGCWNLASFGNSLSGAVQLYEFAPQDSTYLASLVLWEGATLFTYDYKAVQGDTTSVWRVDDEARLDPEAFDALFVVQAGGRRYLAVSWAGAEGDRLALLRARDGEDFVRVVGAYRYLGAR